jgi:hypothetical protein
MTAVETKVRKCIGDICKLPVPDDKSTRLCDLAFNDDMCSDLADELDQYVKTQNPKAGVDDDEITATLSIQKIINLVNAKIAS